MRKPPTRMYNKEYPRFKRGKNTYFCLQQSIFHISKWKKGLYLTLKGDAICSEGIIDKKSKSKPLTRF